jgi:DNA-directed RNA polymerase specialized sigma24 family protein
MTAKAYLKQIKNIDMQILSKLEQAKTLREQAQRITAPMDGQSSGTSVKNVQSFEVVLCQAMDLENDCIQETERLMSLKCEAISYINKMQNYEQRTVLELRYLCGKKWDEIAKIMCYELRSIHNKHGKALIYFSKLKNVH